MQPGKYNRIRYAKGHLNTGHLSKMVQVIEGIDGDVYKHWLELQFDICKVPNWDLLSRMIAQWQAEVDIVDDGMFGPRSLRRFVALYETLESPSKLALTALDVMEENLGKGEQHQDNAGVFLHMIRDWPHNDDFKRPIGNWCAFAVNYAFRQAALRLGVVLPFGALFYDSERNRRMPIGSAKRLGMRIAEAGAYVPVREAQPGDVAVRSYSNAPFGPGHIMMVKDGLSAGRLLVIEGNYGSFPAVIQHRREDPSRVAWVARI